MEKYCAALRDHGKSAQRFLSAIPFVSLGSFIRNEDLQNELRVFRGEYVRDKFPDASSEMVAKDLNADYDGDLDNGDWAGADLESTPGSAVAGGARKIHKSFHAIQ